ncbi:hypothetical protein [Alcanivorax sp. 24]|uniref:hypothetical protein n=1 Tax=Alcanivorax sp. 24 TaxID=2545266 RepID=UPI00105CA453|nr:hypothetical protein [Alcanivorax sp. 24]
MKKLMMMLGSVFVMGFSPAWAQDDNAVFNRLVAAQNGVAPGATLVLHGSPASGVATYELTQEGTVERGTWIALEAALDGKASMYVLTSDQGESRHVFQSTPYTLEFLDDDARFVRSDMHYTVRPAS